MHKIKEKVVSLNGEKCRVLQKGKGQPLGYFPGIGGLPRWFPFLDILAETHCVIVPSLPGFPGGSGHYHNFDHLDWLTTTKDLLVESGLKGANIIASSVSAPLVADIAALWEEKIKKLILISPFGLFEERAPIIDIWAQRPGHLINILCEQKDQYKQLFSAPRDIKPIEWEIITDRSLETVARYLFPFGETGIRKRLHRIEQPTLLLRGNKDMIVPESNILLFSNLIGTNATVKSIKNAGHIAEIDEPKKVATEIINFCNK